MKEMFEDPILDAQIDQYQAKVGEDSTKNRISKKKVIHRVALTVLINYPGFKEHTLGVRNDVSTWGNFVAVIKAIAIINYIEKIKLSHIVNLVRKAEATYLKDADIIEIAEEYFVTGNNFIDGINYSKIYKQSLMFAEAHIILQLLWRMNTDFDSAWRKMIDGATE
jgi:hypothetical protein